MIPGLQGCQGRSKTKGLQRQQSTCNTKRKQKKEHMNVQILAQGDNFINKLQGDNQVITCKKVALF